MRRKLIAYGWVQVVVMIVSLPIAAAALGITARVAWEIVISLACAFGGWG